MSRVRLVALDLDGTALRSNNTLSPAVSAAIQRATESGIEVVAASGRPFQSMPKEILEHGGINYFITSNGAAVYNKRYERIFETPLKESAVLKLLELTRDVDLIWEAFTKNTTVTDKRYYDNPTAYGCSAAYVGYVKGSRGVEEDMRGFIFAHRKELDSVEYVCPEKELRETVRRKIEENTDELYITSSSEHFVEFMDKNATKSKALKKLCKILSVSPKETAACGNADNDADMLRFAGTGAAVENASEFCKKSAGIIIPSNDNDGVAVWLNKLCGD